LHDPNAFGPWLSGIARNVRLTSCRKRHNGHVSLARLGHDHPSLTDREEHSGETAVDHTDQLQHLREAVEALPEEYQAVLRLKYVQGLTYAQMAEKLGVAIATVNYRLARAREALRERLGRDRTV
jgi:RNA polymerase sigma-70 factor (ECF subfamily)